MNEIRAEVLAAQLLRGGKTLNEVVDATGLEPKEVMEIAQKLKLKAAPTQPPANDLEQLMMAVSRESQAARYPKKAQRQLARAADLIAASLVTIADDAGKAEKRAEIARLEEQVRRLKAEVKGDAAKAGQHRRDMKAVRAWAREQGYEVPDKGLLKKDIVEAYDQAVAS